MADENNKDEIKDLETGKPIPEFSEKKESDFPEKKEETFKVEKPDEATTKEASEVEAAPKVEEPHSAEESVKPEGQKTKEEHPPVRIVYSGNQAPMKPEQEQSEESHDTKAEQKEEPQKQEQPKITTQEAPKQTAPTQKTAQEQQTVSDGELKTEPTQIDQKPQPATQQKQAKTSPTQQMNAQPAQPGQPAQPQKIENAQDAKKEVAKNKRIIFGCLGAAIVSFIIFLIIVFIFVSGPAGTPNPLADLLKIDQNTFINGIITIVNIVFIVLALASIVATLAGFFKMSMAKKDDKITKKKGLMIAIIGVVSFIITLMIWVGVYMYLDSKRSGIVEENTNLPPVATEPVDTLNLTAPVSIRFDASHVPIDTKKYQIISYVWDFANGDIQTGQIVSYTFEDKGSEDGRYNVQLTVTKKDRKTGDELEEKFEKVITIANVKVNAKILADPEKGPAPLTVKFDASNSADEDGKIVSYEWDFDGDGLYDDATGVEAEHIFDKVGKYEVGLRVTDNNNEYSEESIIIEAEKAEKPEAVITANNDNGAFEANISYVFDAKHSKSPNGEIKEYFWNFGDGTKDETTRTVSHTFTSPGTYEIELTITDEEGESDTLTEEVTVGAYEADLSAIILTEPGTSNNTMDGEVPLKVNFTAERGKDSPEIIEYHWDFNGDGTTDSFERIASYTYQTPGTYKATLKVVGTNNEQYTTFVTINAKEQGINIDVKASPLEGVIPLTVDFDASGSTHPSSSITSFEWDFGDGTPAKKAASKLSYKYTKIGTFVVTVTGLGADGSSASKQVTINVLPVPLKACFEPSVLKGTAPLTVNFNSACTTGTVVKYNWTFGDSKSDTVNNPVHVFEEAGEYDVALEVSDNDNIVSTASQKITVE